MSTIGLLKLKFERQESFSVANDVKDEKKVGVLVTVIGTKAYRNIIAPAKAVGKTYQQLVDAMKSHLDPKPIFIAERFRFHRRNQREGETMAQYLAELRKLTEHCDFRNNLDETLRDRLVCGILRVPIQKRLLAKKDLDLKKALELAQGMEAATMQSSELRATSGPGCAYKSGHTTYYYRKLLQMWRDRPSTREVLF